MRNKSIPVYLLGAIFDGAQECLLVTAINGEGRMDRRDDQQSGFVASNSSCHRMIDEQLHESTSKEITERTNDCTKEKTLERTTVAVTKNVTRPWPGKTKDNRERSLILVYKTTMPLMTTII